ncbi:Putative conjugal transfer protein TraG N-terminal domain-containing protein [Desulfonema limicola]|uniref:Conjugal transfer protein TraG N-terminal domain-containing protein n=1 Tax=Desulfonema limicola TaxID=45656 RepID=A0A975B462_9BACT|nr:conjugal transfer protein TraG N-terminal domain-containing protein [Desulfonema limicola]QTA78482.1 Putative conjugal transfer protein TraG N-terminal domain-containing protein [Desulfonema limicola]
MWDIYPVGVDAEMLASILNWISQAVYGSSGSTTLTGAVKFMLASSFLMGLITVIITTGLSPKGGFSGFFQWMMGAIIVSTGLFTYPVQCVVHDLSIEQYNANTGSAMTWGHTTNHVPIGIALPLFMATTFELETTSLIDSTFTSNVIPSGFGDYLYLSSGGGIGALGNILLAMHDASMQDPRLTLNTANFAKECLVPAVTLKVISNSELANSDDLMTTIGNNLLLNYYANYENPEGSSPAYTTMACNTYWGQLTTDWTAAQNNLYSTFARQGFLPSQNVNVALDVAEGVMRSAFNNGTLNSADVLRNAWFGRMIDMGIGEAMGFESGAVQLMSQRVREFKADQRAYGIMALMWLPKIKSILLCIVCALWLPLIPFMLLNNFKVPLGWFGLLLWLSLWGVMLSVINAIYTDQLIEVTSHVAATASGNHTLSFGNRWYLWSESTNVLAGMGLSVSWMIPLSGIVLSWLGLKTMSSSAVEQRFNRAAGDISRLEDVSAAGNLHYENTKVMSQGGRPEEMANANAFRYANTVAAPGQSYGMYGKSGAVNPVMNRASVDQALTGTTGNAHTGIQGQSMDMKTEMPDAGFTAANAAMFDQFTSDYQGSFNRGMSASLSETTKASAKAEQGSSVKFAAQEAFKNSTGVDVSTAQQWSKDLGYGADWVHSEEARQGVALAMSVKDHLIQQFGYSDSEATKMTSRYLHTARGNLGLGFGGNIDGTSRTDEPVPNHQDSMRNSKGIGKKGFELGGAYAIATEIANQADQGTGKTAKIDKREDAYTGLDSSAQRSSSDSGSLRTGEKGSMGNSKRVSDTASRIYSALQTYEKSINESESLSHEASEARALQHMFSANAGYNTIGRMFGHHVKSGAVESVNESNVSRHLPEAIASFRKAWEDDRKRNQLMKDYAIEKGIISPEGARAFDSDNMAESPRKMIVQQGISLSDGNTIMEDRDNQTFKILKNQGNAILGSQENIMNTLRQAGITASNKAGDKTLFEDVFNIVANGKKDPESMQNDLNSRLSNISDSSQLQVAAIAAKHAYMQKVTDPIEAAKETAKYYGSAIQNTFSNVISSIPKAHYQTNPGIIGNVSSETMRFDDLNQEAGNGKRSDKTGNISVQKGTGNFDVEGAGDGTISLDNFQLPFSSHGVEIGNKYDALKDQILSFKDKGLLSESSLSSLSDNMQTINNILDGKSDKTINQVLGVGEEAIKENVRDMNEFVDRHKVSVKVSDQVVVPFNNSDLIPSKDENEIKGMQWK